MFKWIFKEWKEPFEKVKKNVKDVVKIVEYRSEQIEAEKKRKK